MILDGNFDLFLICETWLAEIGDEAILKNLTPAGYLSKSFPRKERTGGGLAIVYKKDLEDKITFDDLSKYNFKCFESFKIMLRCSKNVIRIISHYRPPDNLKNSYSNYISEFNYLVTELTKTNSPLIILGDFNIRFNNPERPEVRKFLHLLEHQNLIQHVQAPTNNKSGNTIDLVITSQSTKVSNLSIIASSISDHDVVEFSTAFEKSQRNFKHVYSRNCKKINMSKFKIDISKVLSENRFMCIAELDGCLREILDAHAPVKQRVVTERRCPWFNEDIIAARKTKRQKERHWRKTKTPEANEQFNEARNILNYTKQKAKQNYFLDKLENSNIKDFYRTLNDILCKPSGSQLPNYTNQNQELANDFLTYFLSKVEMIQDHLKDLPLHTNFLPFKGNTKLTKFRLVTQTEIQNLILNSPTKSCELDALPSNILKMCIEELIEPITNVINHSLNSGVVPVEWKQAIVRPLLKKENLDQNQLSNYRPVSNLGFISKILEKVILSQLLEHCLANDLNEEFQSAYRNNHSTETATLKIRNDLLANADRGRISMLTLLDASAAFDCVDHGILLERLEKSYGIEGVALTWLESYMSGRTLKVAIGSDYSNTANLTCGVPQGSCLGPILYTMYTKPIFQLFKARNFEYHGYADDLQLYTHCENRIEYLRDKKIQIENCVTDVKTWMDGNRLKLNESKTEFLLCAKTATLKHLDKCQNLENLYLSLGPSKVPLSNSVKNLGVYFDNNLDMSVHVSVLLKSIYFGIKRLSNIRNLISCEVAKKIAVFSILSRIDYCNSLLYGANEYLIDRIQVAMNNAARVVLRRHKNDSATKMLRDLHWLPVRKRIQFKIACLCFGFFDNSLPSYLFNDLNLYTQQRALRSASDIRKFTIPVTKSKTGEKAWYFAAPTIWNSLPLNIRNSKSKSIFKKRLKTFYFNSL